MEPVITSFTSEHYKGKWTNVWLCGLNDLMLCFEFKLDLYILISLFVPPLVSYLKLGYA